MSRARSDRLVARVAIALWKLECEQLVRGDGGTMPAFYSYADGEREPMPFRTQSAAFQRWWLGRARQVLRAVLAEREGP